MATGKRVARQRISIGVLISLVVSGCALFAPLPSKTTLDQRLAAFPRDGLPLRGPVTVYWDDHEIPFIEAAHDVDAAFVLGLVHAHLRLGQMEVYRRISQGRIAEMGGPLAADIDYGIRIIGFGRAAEATEAALPETTRAWLQSYVDGINHVLMTAEKLPAEFRILGLDREPWTIRDVLTFGRLAGTDVNWLVWANLLRLRGRDDWPALWARLVGSGTSSLASFDGGRDLGQLAEILAGLSRSGSNSIAIAPAHSKTGAALMANDPHLGISIPDIWLIAGVKSPSYHAVGLMVPGLPFWAIGRNMRIAWGGTNMRAAASELYDISGLAPSEITERRETIKVRWWLDREVTIRDTKYGPVFSDAPQLAEFDIPPVALSWVGHHPSDEISAMLEVAKAQDFPSFRKAFRSFAVSGQNMLYADAQGNIGQVMAAQVPRRLDGPPEDLILDPAKRAAIWQDLVTAEDLPFSINPAEGFLASANNRPAETEYEIGWFFSPDDRIERMTEIVGADGKLGVAELEALQRDVVMPSARALKDLYVAKLDALGVSETASGNAAVVIDLLRGWNGAYRMGSRGPLAFELFRDGFTGAFYGNRFGDADWSAFAGIARIKTIMAEDIAHASEAELRGPLETALAHAAENIDDFADWGEMHRLGLAHPLGFLPVIGGRFRFGDYPIGGSTDTLMKTAHSTTSERHTTRYGSNARHISDLSDPDRNWFVLLGGQDGWFNSANFLDHVPLWLDGRYIEVPLRIETVRDRFRHKTELAPAG